MITYTGHGGRDPKSGMQIADQEFTRGNLALARSCEEGRPVRVVRGTQGDPTFSPSSGLRYDGLYNVESYWRTRGLAGFWIYQYRLVRQEDSLPEPDGLAEADEPADGAPAARSNVTTQRLVRSTAVVRSVKRLHAHHCQVWGPVSKRQLAHTPREHTYEHWVDRTTDRTSHRTSCAYARTIMSASTAEPS